MKEDKVIVWYITTKKVKGFKRGTWIITEPYKKSTEAITHFLGSFTCYKESDIIKIEKIKL